MDKMFYPKRGAKAWPDGCPCCGETVSDYTPEDDVMLEAWEFSCGCVITMDPMIYVETDCPDAMAMCLEGLVIDDEAAK
jgi:hypothetical protein